MADPRIEKWASLLIHYSLEIRPGQQLAIFSNSLAEELLHEVYAEAIKAGAHVALFLDLPQSWEIFYKHASDAQLDYVSPITKLIYETFDARLSIQAEHNTRSLSGADPAKMSRRAKAQQPNWRIFFDRSARGELRWCSTLYPTNASAQEADMSLSDYREFVFAAGNLNDPDPVFAWRREGQRQLELQSWLKGRDRVVMKGKDIDLSLSIRDRSFITSDGKFIESEAYSPIHIAAGVQQMDGNTALKYARSRETTSDFDRSARQQIVMFAIKDKALSLGVLANPVKVSNILSTLGKHIKTNLGAPEIKELAGIVEKIDKSKSISEVIDNNPKDGLLISISEGGYYLKPKSGNYKEIQQMVKNIFASADDTYAQSEVTVNVFNGSGKTGLAKQLADTLSQKGFTIGQIATDETISSRSTIYDGTNGSSSLETIKGYFNSPKVEKLDSKGIIKIVIGQDYGK